MGKIYFFKDLKARILDKIIIGQDVSGRYVSSFEDMGANPVQSTDYDLIRTLIRERCFEKTDNITDIGCGMGRVLGYLKHKGFSGKLTGIEVDKTYADFCQHIFSKIPNIEIRCENAVESPIDENDVVYMYNPFSEPLMKAFLERHRHLRKIVYCNDISKNCIEECGLYVLEKSIDGFLDDGTPVPISIWVRRN